ncbi:MAG TPA: 3-oxoacyl-ACP synthase, partial [Rhodocyclaceae bacterium]|nr:3-oxoacyl-ACP synthase [Rhodocyclaceae bacterium]
MSEKRIYSRIIGTGSYLPGDPVNNHDLVARGIETSDEWIVERTGISARHYAPEGVFSSDLALEASKRALEAANCSVQEVDLIIVATSTPDMVFPSTAALLQNKLGMKNGAPALDVQAV